MVFFNEKYEKVWYVHLAMDICNQSQPKVFIDEYENVVIEQSTRGSLDRCDINCVSINTTRPFCRVCDVFDNEEDANKHKEALILKGEQLLLTYAKEMIESIRQILKKVGMRGKEQFIANKEEVDHNLSKLTWAKVNFYQVILTNGRILNLGDIADAGLLYDIILSLKNRNFFVLSEDYNLHKEFNSFTVFNELMDMQQNFCLKLKGYKV